MLVDSQQDAADGLGVEPSAPKGARYARQSHVPLAIPYWAAQDIPRDCAAIVRVVARLPGQSFDHRLELFESIAPIWIVVLYDNRARLAGFPVEGSGHPEDPGAIVDRVTLETLGYPAHGVLGAIQFIRPLGWIPQQPVGMPPPASPDQNRVVMWKFRELLYATRVRVAGLEVEICPEGPEPSYARLGAGLTQPRSHASVDFLMKSERDCISGSLYWVRIEASAHGLTLAGQFVAHLYALFGG